MINAVYLTHKRLGDVVAHQLKIRIVDQVQNVGLASGKEVIQAENFVSLFQETLAEMGADKTSPACDQNSMLHLATPSHAVVFKSFVPKVFRFKLVSSIKHQRRVHQLFDALDVEALKHVPLGTKNQYVGTFHS